jgi:hypothetical protein
MAAALAPPVLEQLLAAASEAGRQVPEALAEALAAGAAYQQHWAPLLAGFDAVAQAAAGAAGGGHVQQLAAHVAAYLARAQAWSLLQLLLELAAGPDATGCHRWGGQALGAAGAVALLRRARAPAPAAGASAACCMPAEGAWAAPSGSAGGSEPAARDSRRCSSGASETSAGAGTARPAGGPAGAGCRAAAA